MAAFLLAAGLQAAGEGRRRGEWRVERESSRRKVGEAKTCLVWSGLVKIKIKMKGGEGKKGEEREERRSAVL